MGHTIRALILLVALFFTLHFGPAEALAGKKEWKANPEAHALLDSIKKLNGIYNYRAETYLYAADDWPAKPNILHLLRTFIANGSAAVVSAIVNARLDESLSEREHFRLAAFLHVIGKVCASRMSVMDHVHIQATQAAPQDKRVNVNASMREWYGEQVDYMERPNVFLWPSIWRVNIWGHDVGVNVHKYKLGWSEWEFYDSWSCEKSLNERLFGQGYFDNLLEIEAKKQLGRRYKVKSIFPL